MYHHPNRFTPSRRKSAKLDVPYADFDAARAMFPHCEATALRAFVRSEASRLANALIRPIGFDGPILNVVAMFADCDAIGSAATRSKRFDFVVMLLKGGKFERKIARRLVRAGKLSAEFVL